jgi:hypothetical protein
VDSNRISLVPLLRLGHPCWTSSTPFHAPISYVWVSCPHHSLPFEEKSSSTSVVLETDPAQHKGEWGCKKHQSKNIVRRNVTIFPIVYHLMSHKIASISRYFVMKRHMMCVITILQKISTSKGHNRNSLFIARKCSTEK